MQDCCFSLKKKNCYQCRSCNKQEIRTVFYFLRGRASWIQSEIDIISKIFILSIN